MVSREDELFYSYSVPVLPKVSIPGAPSDGWRLSRVWILTPTGRGCAHFLLLCYTIRSEGIKNAAAGAMLANASLFAVVGLVILKCRR
jgi:hypothetical protein